MPTLQHDFVQAWGLLFFPREPQEWRWVWFLQGWNRLSVSWV